MKVWELIQALVVLPEDDEVVVWHDPTQQYIAAEGIRAEDGKVEVAAIGNTKIFS